MEWQFFEEDEKVDQEILNSDVMTDEVFKPDPELLERLERMVGFGRRYSRLAFHVTDGKMYVGLDQIVRDAFEVDLRKPLDYNRIRGNISIDVQVIKDLIEVMKLDEKTDSIKMSDMRMDRR